MTATRQLNGSWLVYDLIDGYLVQRVYYGYTKADALASFKAEFKRKQVQ